MVERPRPARLAVVAALVVIATMGVALLGCGGGEGTTTAGPAGGGGPDASTTPPAPTSPPPAEQTATIVTKQGDIVIKLATDIAPKTVAKFVGLARQGFFDGLTFHRIIPGFVIQGGDPKGDGTGGSGSEIVEAPPEDFRYTTGTVAMAKRGSDPAGTSDSQFYVCTKGGGCDQSLSAQPGAPAQYAVLGRVVTGQDVVEKIAAAKLSDPQLGVPAVKQTIEKVTISP